MGKSFLANQWRFIGVPVHDADKIVHNLMRPNGAAFDAVAKQFPDIIIKGNIDRKALGKIVFFDADKRKVLEDIIHPLVRQSSTKFIQSCRRRRLRLCILDIPLLFETGRDKQMDEIICVTAPKWVQARRVLLRKNMTLDKYKSIVKTQMPDYRKRMLSDHVVFTGNGARQTLNAIKKIKNNER